MINSKQNHRNYSDKNRFDLQDKLNPQTQKKNSYLVTLISKILENSTSYQQGIHPRIFCRRWFGLEDTKENGRPRFTEEQILAMESEYGYREKCINLISQLLKIKPNTVHRWGKGVSFNKIPNDKRQKYEIYLGYIDAIRVITTSLDKLDEASLSRVLQQLEKKQ